MYTLFEHIPACEDPLGPDNLIGFVRGLLIGTRSVVTGRWMVARKSPLTGDWGDSNCGVTLSPAIKQCGYECIFINGVSTSPVYRYGDHKTAEIRTHLPTHHLCISDAY